jgi:hypothetical protein
MVERLRQMPGFEGTNFTIFHTAEFNYLQVSPSWIRGTVDRLAGIVGADSFPEELGLIGIPYSQGSALFLNCLLAHEIGEYVFDLRKLYAVLRPEIEIALEHQLGEEFAKKESPERSLLVGVVAKWAKELFCDLLAVRLIGPCYTLAYVELFDVVRLLDKGGTLPPSKLSGHLPFYRDHPSHTFRLKHQAALLKALDWWNAIVTIDSRYLILLQNLLALSENDTEFVEASGEQGPYVRALLEILPELRTHLGAVTGNLESGVHEFSLLCEPVCNYLENGIVPSTMNVDPGTGTLEPVHPSVVTLLNAAFRFYLERIEQLMARLKDQDPNSLERRVWWINRVQAWTAKALEDVRLLRVNH